MKSPLATNFPRRNLSRFGQPVQALDMQTQIIRCLCGFQQVWVWLLSDSHACSSLILDNLVRNFALPRETQSS